MALHSDHVNYLILRYLQESGLEQTASSLYTEWQRPYNFRDPETLPFAPVVERGELISVLHKGIWHDELQARILAGKGRVGSRRQFRWAGTSPRQESADAQMLENGASRPSSSGERRRRSKPRRVHPPPSGMPAPDEFPTPPPKRARRSEGSEGAQLNGESMDVDTALSPSLADAEGEDDPDLASPMDEPTTEVIEVPERYDSMDVATQTEVKVGTKTSTMYWTVGEAGMNVLKNVWNPKANDTLLTVGEGLCRMHRVKSDIEEGEAVTQDDLADLPANAVITAVTWRPDGRAATCAIDFAPSAGQPAVQQMLLEHQLNPRTTTTMPSTSLLEPAGIVIRMQYNSPNGRYLLVLRNNLKRGLVQIWDTRHDKHSTEETKGTTPPVLSEPIAYQIFERPVLDACWLSAESFVVVGEAGLASMHALAFDGGNQDSSRIAPLTPTSLTAETVLCQGLRDSSNLTILDAPSQEITSWSKVTADTTSGIIAVASSPEAHKLAVLAQGSNEGDWKSTVLDLPSPITDLAFQPHLSSGPDGASESTETYLLAATLESGVCIVYNLSTSSTDSDPNSRLVVREHATLLYQGKEGGSDPALAATWSPDGGSHLAVAGSDTVRVWDMSKVPDQVQQQTDVNVALRPLVEWHFEPSAIKKTDDEEGTRESNGEHVLSEPSLSWSADAGKLAFSAGDVIAVITFQPKLLLQWNDVEEPEERAEDVLPSDDRKLMLEGDQQLETPTES